MNNFGSRWDMNNFGSREAHKVGCWYRNGGPNCTCSRKTTATGRNATRPILQPVPHFRKGDDDDMVLDKLRNFDPRGGIQIEDAVALAAFGRQLASEYDALKIDKPAFLEEKVEDVRRFIADSQRDARKKKLAELKARRLATLTASERRDLLDKEIAELEAIAQ